ncbi:hypothetical protein, partial [Candidatus Venteria ishoeyi]|uniref:hypothetical protein n=1 Tax=Candidatus Venteria ishoeyi TaxID=1899563 RepID=UPI0011B00F5B
MNWTGQSDTLIAHGLSQGDNAFSIGEEFGWKIWRASNGTSASANAFYHTENTPDSGFFVAGGLSKIDAINAVSGTDIGISDLLWPQNSCNNLSSAESLELQITNFGIGSTFNFQLSVSINENWFDTTLSIATVILQDSAISLSLPLNINLSDTGSYDIMMALNQANDLIPQNDSLLRRVENYALPELSISGPDSIYCQNNTSQITLTGFPIGGYFTGNNVLNSIFYPATIGINSIDYLYTDNLTGCSASLQRIIEVLESPQIDLGENQTACEGDTILLQVPDGFATYQWSHGLGIDNIAEISFSGNFSLSVTAQNSCTSNDEV